MKAKISKPKLTLACLAGALAVLALGALGARAASDQSGTLLGSFHGTISPSRLPRTELAPVAVQMGGKIKTTDKSTPPKLLKIVLQINANGKIQTKGLGSCSLGKLNSVSAATARRSCGDALIGHGNVTSRVTLPGQGAFASNGSLLAFNGTYKGHPAVLAQVESGPPLPLTYVIPFTVTKTKGTYGTELDGTLPEIASEYGYISAFDLSLGRSYRYHGQQLSYASASCPAPKGFTLASFPFAKSSYVFADGRTLAAIVEGKCKVRGK
jgi:hypothetical protein